MPVMTSCKSWTCVPAHSVADRVEEEGELSGAFNYGSLEVRWQELGSEGCRELLEDDAPGSAACICQVDARSADWQ